MGSEDQFEIDQLRSRLEQELDAASPQDRARLAERLRILFRECAEVLSAEDEDVMNLYIEGVLDIRHLQDHFGMRFTKVLLRGQGHGDV